ncbi:MAG: HU family DNA-binding protein [Bacteroides sp.]
MSEKLTIQDLARGAAETLGMTKGNAELFVKEFFQLIADALHQDKYVKVKGLGTFKLIEVDSRASVHIKTGERIEIQGHTKVSFTPDATLRDIINRPFAHFETVPLQNEELLLSTAVETESSTEELELVNETPLSESLVAVSTVAEVNPSASEKDDNQPTDEISAPLEETPVLMEEAPVSLEAAPAPLEEEYPPLEEELQERALNVSQSAVEEPLAEEVVVEEAVEEIEAAAEEDKVSAVVAEEAVEETAAAEVTAKEEEPIVEEPAEESAIEELPLRKSEVVTAGLVATEEVAVAEAAEEVVAAEEAAATEEVATATAEEQSEQRETMRYFIGIVIFVSLLCIGVLVFIYFPGLTRALYGLKEPVEQREDSVVNQPVQVPLQQAEEYVDSLNSDTLKPKPESPKAVTTGEASTPAPNPSLSKPSVSKPVSSQSTVAATPFVPDSSSYEIVGTQESYTLKEGETLTRVSLRYWGTKKLWPYLVKHNPTVIKNPDNVPYGTTIKIPKLKKK